MNGIADLYKLADVAAGKPSPMMLFPIGDWTSDKYADLTLSQALADEVIANFEANVLRTKVPVDTNHDPKSPANGWIDRLYMAPYEWQGLSGEALYADWTPNELGAALVNDGQFAYDSIDLADYYTDPATGTKHDNVLKAVSLANRPVLRMMPGVRDAGDALKLAEPRTFQLSEFTAAEPTPDPVTAILDDMDALAAKLDGVLKGKAGMPAMRTMLKEVRTKASAHALAEAGSTNDQREALEQALSDAFGAMHEGLYVEDFGPDWVVFHTWSAGMAEGHYYRVDYSGTTFGQTVEVERDTTYVPVIDSSPAGAPATSSAALSEDAKAKEGKGKRLAEGDAAQKGVDPMKTVALKLNLAEDASEEIVLAEVVKLSDERDAAVAKLAEVEKAKRDAAIEATLTELVDGGHVLPGQKDAWTKLAEDSPESFAVFAVNAKKVKAIQLSEVGTSEGGESSTDDPTVELDNRAKKLAEERSIPYGDAMSMALAEDPALAGRYNAREL